MNKNKRRHSETEEDSVVESKRPHLDNASSETCPDPSLAYPPTSNITRTPHATPFQKPQSLLTFSYSPSRLLEFNDSAMRYYVEPPREADLRNGYDRWIRRPEEKGRIDGLLRGIAKIGSDKEKRGESSTAWLRDVGIVSWRGVMTKILTAPYEERDAWELNIMLLDGTLYLEEYISDAKIHEKNNIPPKQRIQMYYGYSFESYCTSERPPKQNPRGRMPGWGGDVDTNVQWCCVAKTKLADTRIIIGGEVDCVRERFDGTTDNFVELKTSLTIRGPQDEARFEKKLLKFYFQSFLLGVPEIIVGFRTPSGRLTTLQEFQTLQIPRMVRDKPGSWDPQLCLEWGSRFITFLKENVSPPPTQDTPCIWRASFTPKSGVTLKCLDQSGVDEVINGEDRFGFLPSWYINESMAQSTVLPDAPISPRNTDLKP